MENIINIGQSTIIINGGNPLDGCPKDWEEARQIIEGLNLNKDEECDPQWSFDCGFKLDYDGPILLVSSRFYPPKTHYGATWDGNVSIYFIGKKIKQKSFDLPTLQQLTENVEAYVKLEIEKIQSALKAIYTIP